jgi:glycosyltransferase involved in cell wall biosynthesis
VTRHQGASAATYLREYASFFVRAAARLLELNRRHAFALVQVHNPPDLLVFATLLLKLRGVPVVVDLRELMPELFMSRFGLERQGLIVRILTVMERFSCSYANAVLVLHERHRRIMEGRGISPGKLTQVMNCPDDAIFSLGAPRSRPSQERRFVVLNHGGMMERYGVDLLVRAVARVRGEIPGLQLELYGTGDHLPEIERLVDELGVNDLVRFHGQRPLEEMPDAIAGADVGVAPMRQDVFTDCGLPTKLLEYVALGLPAITSRTATTADYFDDDMVAFFTPGDAEDLARQLLHVYHNRAGALARAERAQRFTRAHNWTIERSVYLGLIDRLLEGGRSSQNQAHGPNGFSRKRS